MADYIFKFNDINIKELRSASSDTDFASLAVKVGSNMYGPVTASLGDLHKGLHGLNLAIGPLNVPDDATPVLISWTVINAGHKKPEDALKAVAGAAGAIAGVVGTPAIGVIVGAIGGAFAQLIGNFTNHDGPCIIQAATITGHELNKQTRKDWNPQFENHPGDNGRYDSHVIAYQPAAYPHGI